MVKTHCVTKVAAPVPVADFAANVVPLGGSPVQVLFSDRSTGIVSSWLWDFGDGTTSTGPNPGHWYAPGIYTVNLTATNSGGSTSCVKNITVSPAETAFSKEWMFESGTEEGFTGVDTWGDGINVSVSSTAHDGAYPSSVTSNVVPGMPGHPWRTCQTRVIYRVDYWIQSSGSGYGFTNTGIKHRRRGRGTDRQDLRRGHHLHRTDLNEICDRPANVWVRHVIGWEKDTGVIDHMVYDANGTLLGFPAGHPRCIDREGTRRDPVPCP